jgi:zinc and cadmium transporter
MLELIFFSLVGGVFSLAGGLLLLWKPHITKKVITPLISFGAGAFLAAAFLDILPEAIEASDEPHTILGATLAGFLMFFILERLVMKLFKEKHLPHSHSEHTESLPILLVLGDTLHNFLDGIIIALAFTANPALGLPAALAIAAHEVPQEIGDFSVMLNLGINRKKIVAINILQSLMTIPGVILGSVLGGILDPYLPLSLALTAGIFIYIAASDLIPELHHHSGHKYLYRVVLPMIGSVLLVSQLSKLAH